MLYSVCGHSVSRPPLYLIGYTPRVTAYQKWIIWICTVTSTSVIVNSIARINVGKVLLYETMANFIQRNVS